MTEVVSRKCPLMNNLRNGDLNYTSKRFPTYKINCNEIYIINIKENKWSTD